MIALQKPNLPPVALPGTSASSPRAFREPTGNTGSSTDAGAAGGLSQLQKLNILAMLHSAESLLIKGELDRVTNILETVASMTRPTQ